MALRGVLFDLGGTLVRYHPPDGDWREMEEIGGLAVRKAWAERGHKVPSEEIASQTFWERMRKLWYGIPAGEQDESGHREHLSLEHQLRELGLEWGLNLTVDDVRAGLKAYVDAVQAVATPMPGAVETLAELRDRGMRLGVISNTIWPAEHHWHDLERFGMVKYLQVALFSAQERAWKPGRVIFERALRALGLEPAEVIFVGDSLVADVYGAQRVGMRGVWIKQPYIARGLNIEPDATIEQLPELVEVVREWSNAGFTTDPTGIGGE